MGLFEFMKDAGEKVFGRGEAKEAAASAAAAEAAVAEEAAERRKANDLTRFVLGMKLPVSDLRITFDDGKATVYGRADSQAVKENVIIGVGNVQGVGQVDDRMQVDNPAPPAKFYTVERGDTLSKIAKEFYGDAMKYPTIFEANRPMLSDPDKIYPGQVLRIPAAEA